MCPFGFYEVMQMCFHEEAEGRPSFRIIHELLVEVMIFYKPNWYLLCSKLAASETAEQCVKSV